MSGGSGNGSVANEQGEGEPVIKVAEGSEEFILTRDQAISEDNPDLDARICDRLDGDERIMQDINERWDRGEFDPGFFRKILLWAASLFGGTEYDTAVEQLRMLHVLSELSGENKEKFLTGLAEATLSRKPDEIEGVCQVMYDLLGENPAMRRDFFVNKLLVSCTERMATSAESGNAQEFVEQAKKSMHLESFCQTHELEIPDDTYASLNISDEAYVTMRREFFMITVHNLIINGEGDVDSLNLVKYIAPLDDPCSSFLESDCLSNFLQCFAGEGSQDNKTAQIQKYTFMVEKLREINNEAREQPLDPNDLAGRYISLFSENVDFLYAMTNIASHPMLDAFTQIIGIPIVPDISSQEFITFCVSEAALEKMQGGNASFTDEQVKLLCLGANLGKLLEDPTENAGDINIFLKFIQDKALPPVTFDDILPNADAAICAKLLKFVSDGPTSYDQKLVQFIKNGAQPKIKDEVENFLDKGQLDLFEGVLENCDKATIIYLCEAFGGKLEAAVKKIVKDGIKMYIEDYDEFLTGKAKSPSLANGSLKDLQNYLRAVGIYNPRNIDEEGVFGFAIDSTLNDLGISRERYFDLPFQVLTKADSPLTPAPNPAPSSLSPT